MYKRQPHGINVTLTAEVIENRLWPTDLPRRQVAQARPSQQHWVCCYVTDNGIGIPPTQRARLFELYARGSRARYMPGLGLGLYLCQQIITAHGGEIGITDSETGTKFWFLLPLATAA